MSELLLRKPNDQDFTLTRVAPLLWAMAAIQPVENSDLERVPLPIGASLEGGIPVPLMIFARKTQQNAQERRNSFLLD